MIGVITGFWVEARTGPSLVHAAVGQVGAAEPGIIQGSSGLTKLTNEFLTGVLGPAEFAEGIAQSGDVDRRANEDFREFSDDRRQPSSPKGLCTRRGFGCIT